MSAMMRMEAVNMDVSMKLEVITALATQAMDWVVTCEDVMVSIQMYQRVQP